MPFIPYVTAKPAPTNPTLLQTVEGLAFAVLQAAARNLVAGTGPRAYVRFLDKNGVALGDAVEVDMKALDWNTCAQITYLGKLYNKVATAVESGPVYRMDYKEPGGLLG